MEYEVLYEYKEVHGITSFAIPILGISLIILFIIFKIRKYFPAITHTRQMVLFFLYLIFSFFLISIAVLIIRLPRIIRNERQLNEAIQFNEFSVVEGAIQDYRLDKINGQYFESFKIKNVEFSYSDYFLKRGFHQTAGRKGPINANGQFLKISYISQEGENIILRIETAVRLE